MLDKLKKISVELKSATIYTLSTLFSRGLAIVTVPIFTRIMSTEEIGIINLYNSWYTMLAAITTLSLTSGGYAVALKEFSDERDQYQSSILSLTSIISILVGIGILLNLEKASILSGLDKPLIVVIIIGLIVEPARDFWLSRHRYEYKYKLTGFITMITAIAASILSIYIVIKARNDMLSNIANLRIYANYFIIYGTSLIIWIYLIIKGKTFFNRKYWSFSLKLSIPLVGYSLSSQVLNVSDRMMISSMVGTSEVGIYGTIYSISSISLLIWNSINTSFVPYLYRNFENNTSKIRKISTNMISLFAAFSILISLLAPEILSILATEEYSEAIFIIPPIASGVFFTSISNMYSNIIVYFRETKYVMYPATIAAMVNVVLNYYFINKFGYMAAAYTTMASYIILAFLHAFWAMKLIKKSSIKDKEIYEHKKILFVCMISIVLTLSGLFLYHEKLIRYIFIVVIIGVIIIIFKKHNKIKK